MDRLSREEIKHRVKDLNSVFIKHMFSRTENPSDSDISPDYMKRIHETGAILLDFSEKLQKFKQSKGVKSNDFQHLASRMKNLIELVNAEKFDFEDLNAWRMGSVMETFFRERWKILSEEFSKIKISLNNRIRQNESISGKICSIREIQEKLDEEQNRMIQNQKNSIKAIRDLELEPYYKDRLIRQLSDQIRNESRDLKLVLIDLFHQYEHEIKRKSGKFSNSSLKKKFFAVIENEKAIENISEKELLEKFENLWNGIIGSEEILEFRKHIKTTQKEQMYKFRHDVKKAFETCFANDRVDIAANQDFEDLRSIENWEFTENNFRSINIEEGKYFNKNRLDRFWDFIRFKSDNYKGLMSELLEQFKDTLAIREFNRKSSKSLETFLIEVKAFEFFESNVSHVTFHFFNH